MVIWPAAQCYFSCVWILWPNCVYILYLCVLCLCVCVSTWLHFIGRVSYCHAHQGILHDLDHIVEVAYHLVVSRRTGPVPPENRWNTLHHNAQTRPCPASPSTTLVLCKVYTRVLAWITSEPLDLITQGAWLIQYTNVGYGTHTHTHTHTFINRFKNNHCLLLHVKYQRPGMKYAALTFIM